jgi:hypothetical protein
VLFDPSLFCAKCITHISCCSDCITDEGYLNLNNISTLAHMDYLFHLLCENKLCTSTIQQEDLDCHQIFASLNQKDEDIIAKQKLLQITKKAHWDSIPTPGSKNKGFRLMKMANHSLRKFGLVVHTRAEINRMESKRWSAKEQKRLEKNPEARQRERPKRGMLTMVDCREPTQISKQNALGLIHLYNKRSVMIAKLIHAYIPHECREKAPFDEEHFIIGLGLYNLNSEDAWGHIDRTPTSVVKALESYFDEDPHYSNACANDDIDEMSSEQGDSDSDESDSEGENEEDGDVDNWWLDDDDE